MKKLVLAAALLLIGSPWQAKADGDSLYFELYVQPALRSTEGGMSDFRSSRLYDPFAAQVPEEVPPERRVWEHRSSVAGTPITYVAGDTPPAEPLGWEDFNRPEMCRVYFGR